MTRIRTTMNCVLLTLVLCGAFALTHSPKISLAFKENNATQLAARYPLRSRTSGFFERSKASFSRPSRSFTYSNNTFK